MNNNPLKGYSTWDSHPDYPREDWKYDVANGDTNLGYWDWVRHNIESHKGDEEQS